MPEIAVRWPDGRTELFRDLPINRYHTLRQGEGGKQAEQRATRPQVAPTEG